MQIVKYSEILLRSQLLMPENCLQSTNFAASTGINQITLKVVFIEWISHFRIFYHAKKNSFSTLCHINFKVIEQVCDGPTYTSKSG